MYVPNYFSALCWYTHCLFYLVPICEPSTRQLPNRWFYCENILTTSLINSNTPPPPAEAEDEIVLFLHRGFVAFTAEAEHCGYYTINRSVADYMNVTRFCCCDGAMMPVLVCENKQKLALCFSTETYFCVFRCCCCVCRKWSISHFPCCTTDVMVRFCVNSKQCNVHVAIVEIFTCKPTHF